MVSGWADGPLCALRDASVGRDTQETMENKRVLKELVHRWNRPIFAKGTDYRAMRAIQDEPEAMEAPGPGSRSQGVRRMVGAMPQRDVPGRDESVGNILDAKAK